MGALKKVRRKRNPTQRVRRYLPKRLTNKEIIKRLHCCDYTIIIDELLK